MKYLKEALIILGIEAGVVIVGLLVVQTFFPDIGDPFSLASGIGILILIAGYLLVLWIRNLIVKK